MRCPAWSLAQCITSPRTLIISAKFFGISSDIFQYIPSLPSIVKTCIPTWDIKLKNKNPQTIDSSIIENRFSCTKNFQDEQCRTLKVSRNFEFWKVLIVNILYWIKRGNNRIYTIRSEDFIFWFHCNIVLYLSRRALYIYVFPYSRIKLGALAA